MTDSENVEIPADLIENVCYVFGCFSRATTPTAQAHQLIKLAVEIHQLATWHPNFDYTSGQIQG